MQGQDCPTAQAIFEELWKIAPQLPQFEQNLADALVCERKFASAEKHFANLANKGFAGPLLKDPYFETFVRLHHSAKVETAAAEQARVIGIASEAFEVPDDRTMPESMAFDAAESRFIIGSTYLRKLIEYRVGRGFSDFGDSSSGNLLQALGVKLDESKRLLYVCTAADTLEMRNAEKRDLGRSGLFIYDLRSGRLQRSLWMHDGRAHLFNDVALGTNGEAYITDSTDGSLFKLTNTLRLKRITARRAFIYPNGIAFNTARNLLYVADVRGLYTVDLQNQHITPIRTSGAISTAAIDGLYAFGNELVAVQAGVNPMRIVAFHLSPDGKEILSARILLENDGRLTDPTGGTIANGRFYFIANSHATHARAGNRHSSVLSVAL